MSAFPENMVTLSLSGECTDVSELLLATEHRCFHELFDMSQGRGGSRYVALEGVVQDLEKSVWVTYG